MKLLACISLLLLSVGGADLCLAQNGSPSSEPPPPIESVASEWKEFSSPEEGFSVLMPGTPKAVSMELDSTTGKISYRAYVLQTAAAGYAVFYSDLPAYSEKPEIIKLALDAARERMLSGNAGMVILSEKDFDLDGHPGREWLYSYGGRITTQRTVPFKGRLYHAVFTTSPGMAFKSGIASANAEELTEFYHDTSKKFLTSFKVMPRELMGGPIGKGQVTTIYGGTGSGAGEADVPEGEVDRMLREEKERNLKSKSGAGSETISHGVLNGFALYKPQPVYPAIAKSAGASGLVTVRVLVDEQGKVIAAQAVSGNPLLRATAVQAARGTLFPPERLRGKAVKVTGVLTYNFGLK